MHVPPIRSRWRRGKYLTYDARDAHDALFYLLGVSVVAQGSIQKRIGKNGRVSWTAIVDLPPVLDPETGKLKRKQKRITAATKKEIELMTARLVAATAQDLPDVSRATVSEFMAHWLDTVEARMKPASIRSYRDMTKNHIVPFIGSLRLSKLTPANLQQLYANRRAAGLSNTTVNGLHNMMHKALDDAVRWEYIHRNVADAVEPPRRDQHELTVWSNEQVRQFLATARESGDSLEPLWTVALNTGMRRGELLGLKWSDVDFDNGSLSVSRTLSRGSGGAYIEQRPKTKSALRRITLPPSAVASLKTHRSTQNAYRLGIGPAWEAHDYVFTNEVGCFLHPNTLTRQFQRATDRAGLPRIRFHDLRHTSATVLLGEGVHPKIAQERLGHATIAMTMDRYSHVSGDMQQSAADALETALNGRKSGVS